MIQEVAKESSGPHVSCFFATPIHITLVLLLVFLRNQKGKGEKLGNSSEGQVKEQNEEKNQQIEGKTIVLDLEEKEDADSKLTNTEQKQTNIIDNEEIK